MSKDSPSLADVLKDVAKKYSIRIGSMSEVADEVVGLTTGNLAIDYITGCGGLPVGRIVELYGQPSSGKAQPLDSHVLTPSGYLKMGELREGDAVIDPVGAPSVVTGVFPQGVQPVYRLAFSDGSTCEATGDHLWTIEVYVMAFGWISATVTTEQLLRRLETSHGRPRVRLPQVEPMDFNPPGPLPLDPYLVGLLLGDGGLTGKATMFTTKDEELLDAVRRLLPDDCEVMPQSSKVRSISWRLNGMTKYVREIGLSGLSSEAKFVPELYRYQPAATRLALLQGLMDTDGRASPGTHNAGHGTAEFCSVSRQLAQDVLWLARSLGLKAAEGKVKKTFYRRVDGERAPGTDAYRIRIYQTPEVRVFRLPRKLKPITPGPHHNRELVSVEHVRDEECQCISVSAPSRLYVTNDFIPTHNTTTALQAAAALQSKIIEQAGDDHILYLDFEHAMDGEYAANLGLDVEHPSFILVQPHWLEDGADIGEKLIRTDKVRLSIWDSVAEMTPKELEFGVRTNAMERARLMGSLLQRLNSLLHEHRCAGVFLNHMVEAVQMGGRPGMPPLETSPGGKALKFYASLRLAYKQIKNIKGKAPDALTGQVIEQIVATHVRVKVTKNKVGKAWREAEVRVRLGAGFDDFWSALQVLVAHQAITTTTTGHFYFDNTTPAHTDMPISAKGSRPFLHGEAAVLAFADEHPDWRQATITAARDTITSYGAEDVFNAAEPDDTGLLEALGEDAL